MTYDAIAKIVTRGAFAVALIAGTVAGVAVAGAGASAGTSGITLNGPTGLHAYNPLLPAIPLSAPGDSGVISELSTTSITLTTRVGTSTFTVTPATTVSAGRVATSTVALALGENVAVVVNPNDPTSAVHIDIELDAVIGRVRSVNGDVIVVAHWRAANSTVIASAATTVSIHGALGTLANVTAGSCIVAEGTVSSVSRALKAVSIGVGAQKWMFKSCELDAHVHASTLRSPR